MERRTIEQLERVGFQKMLERGNLVYMAKVTSDGDTMAYHLCNKETGLSTLDYANTISFDHLHILCQMAQKLGK